MKYMLDTNICIYCIKKASNKVISKLTSYDPKDICISSITYAELMYGVEKSKFKEKNMIALMMFISSISILDFDMNASTYYGTIRSELEKKGTPIGPMDMLIAAHALSNNLILVTNNIKEFKRVNNIQLENWAN